jgi:hypothetical protein
LFKTINSLIDLFEYCFNQNYNKNCIQIYYILIKYVETFYQTKYDQLVVKSPTASTTTSPTSIQQSTNKLIIVPSSQIVKKQEFDQPVEQYEIRRNIFEFLTRIRSDEQKKLYLLPKINDRKKIKISKSLTLET